MNPTCSGGSKYKHLFLAKCKRLALLDGLEIGQNNIRKDSICTLLHINEAANYSYCFQSIQSTFKWDVCKLIYDSYSNTATVHWGR